MIAYTHIPDSQENVAPDLMVHSVRSGDQKTGNGHLSILLVDDREHQAYLFRDRILSSPSLRELRPEIDVVSSFDEVVSKLNERYYDIGISDLHCKTYVDGINIMKHFIANNAKGIALISASEIDKEKLTKIKNELFPDTNTDFKLASFRRPVWGERFRHLEEWLTSLHNSKPPSPDNSSVFKAMFKYPNAPFTILFTLIFIFSIISFLFWTLGGIALIHPILSLTGMIGGGGLLIEVIVGIKYEKL